ncbi:hypothetical protein COU75_02960, partial [Candidatus Peregrinibacteria bacterium CG10_big_fil_rev_8_21_14_0_10_42_8]
MKHKSTILEEERQELLRQEGDQRNREMIAESEKNTVKTSIADRIRLTGSMLSMALTDIIDDLKPSPRTRNRSRDMHSFPAQLEHLEPIVLMSATPIDVVTEDFSGDLSQWNIDTSASGADIHIDNGELVSANLGALVTKSDFRGTAEAPITVSGTWKPIRDDASNTHSMTLRLRNNGDANDYRGQNGVYLVAYTNNDVFIGQWNNGEHQKLDEDRSRPLHLGETYHFSVTDNGSEIHAVITNKHGIEVINLTGSTAEDIAAGGKIVLQARERGMSHFDDVRISTIEEEVEEIFVAGTAAQEAVSLTEYKDQILLIGSSTDVSSLVGSEHIPDNAVSLADAFELENGTSYPNAYSRNNESIEGITFHSHADAKPLSFSNGLLIADGGYWEANVTFDTPTYVHAFSLGQISGGATAWIQLTYEDGTTFRQDAGRGGTFLINATVTKIYYDRGRSDGAFGIRDVLIAGPTEQPLQEVSENVEAVNAVLANPDALAEILDGSSDEPAFVGPVEASVSEQINALQLQKANIDTLLAQQENALSDAEERVSNAQEIVARFAEQGDPEHMKVTPRITIQAQRFQYYFRLNYTDMPEGYSLKIDNDTTTIPKGSGGMDITDLPRPGGNVSYTLNLVNNNGEQVSHIGVVSIYQGKISRGGTTSFTSHLSTLSYVPTANDESVISAEQNSHAETAIIEGGADIVVATTEIQRLQSEGNTVQDSIDTLERSLIPYSAMHVSVNEQYAHMFTVQYMSNHPQTYIEASRRGEPGMVFQQTISHPGGEADGRLVLNPGNGNVGNHVRIWMYTDDTKTELLDFFEGDLGRSESNGVWGEREMGRTVENPIQPTVDIQKISGPNILVSFSSPYDESRLVLEGGGLFATKTVRHEGGEDMETVMLTFNADKPEWNYRLRMFETRNNREIAGVTLHWDPVAKELSVLGENTDIPVEADSDNEIALNVMRDVFDAQTSVDTIDVSFASLRQVQGFHMYTASDFIIDPDNAAFYINQSSWKGHPDANGQFMQGLDSYEKILAELLQDAARIKVSAMSGKSQQPAIDFLEQQYNVLAYTQYVLELRDFGVTLPTVEQVRDEGIGIFEANTEDFKTQQIKNVTMRKRV